MIVYKTTNIINGKIYVGQTVRNDPHYLGSGTRLKYAIEKYGISNFTRETLCECSSRSDLDKMEKLWIRKLQSKNPTIGYNLESGGRRFSGKSGETANKISESLKGRTFSDEHRENMKKAWKTRPPVSEETKKKMSESKRGIPTWNKGVTGYSTAKKGRKYGPNSKSRKKEG